MGLLPGWPQDRLRGRAALITGGDRQRNRRDRHRLPKGLHEFTVEPRERGAQAT
jgi:hypothetical protein